MDCNCGFWTVQPKIYLKFIFVVCNFNHVCLTDNLFGSRSFDLCCLKVLSGLTFSFIANKGKFLVKLHKMNSRKISISEIENLTKRNALDSVGCFTSMYIKEINRSYLRSRALYLLNYSCFGIERSNWAQAKSFYDLKSMRKLNLLFLPLVDQATGSVFYGTPCPLARIPCVTTTTTPRQRKNGDFKNYDSDVDENVTSEYNFAIS